MALAPALRSYERTERSYEDLAAAIPADASACVSEDGEYIRWGELVRIVPQVRRLLGSMYEDEDEREDRWDRWVRDFTSACSAERKARGYVETDTSRRKRSPRLGCKVCRGRGEVPYVVQGTDSWLDGQTYYRVCVCSMAEVYGEEALDPTGELAVEARLARAGLPGKALRERWTLDSLADLPVEAEGRLALEIAREYGKGLYSFRPQFNQRSALLVSGDYGTGKTGLVCGILRELTRREPSATMRFISWSGLLGELKDAYASGSGADRILVQQLRSVDYLALDDLGDAERTEVSSWERQTAEDVLLARYNAPAGGTLFTTNLTRKQLELQLGGRLADRIYGDWAVALDVPGASLRGQEQDAW